MNAKIVFGAGVAIGIVLTSVIFSPRDSGEGNENFPPSTSPVVARNVTSHEIPRSASLLREDPSQSSVPLPPNGGDHADRTIFDELRASGAPRNSWTEAGYRVLPGEHLELTGGEPSLGHEAPWLLFSRMAPDEFTNRYVEAYVAYFDPSDESHAYVDDEDRNGKWRLRVNGAQYGKRDEMQTIIHEFAHIVFLNPGQLEQVRDCPRVRFEEGCARPNSYVQQFVTTFWSDEMIARAGGVSGYAPQNSLAETHATLFVTPYAATNADEDIAESFAAFVLNIPVDPDTVAAQKVVFFSVYPELVSLRKSIREGLDLTL